MSDKRNNNMNNVQNNNDSDKKEKAAKLSDAIGELSEKTVSDTDSKRKSAAESADKSVSVRTAGIWRAKKICIPAVSAAACGAIVLSVLFGSGILKNDISGDISVHTDSNNAQIADNSSSAASVESTLEGSNSFDSGTALNKAETDKSVSEHTGANQSDKNGGSVDSDIQDKNIDPPSFGFETKTTESEATEANSTTAVITSEEIDSEPATILDTVQKPGSIDMSQYIEVLGQAEYPDTAPYVTFDMLIEMQKEMHKAGNYEINWSDLNDLWLDERKERLEADDRIDHEALAEFDKKTSSAFLSGTEGENRVYSPANVYLALSVLAELTEGESREQILALTGFDDIKALREQAAALWKNLYCFDGTCETVLANSLWLNKGLEVNADTVNNAADKYFASVFRGDMASEETLAAMRKWLNDQTGGLLEDSADSLTLSPDTLMTLCSTVYFHARWFDEFDESENDFRTFHGYNGDKETEFMNLTRSSKYYWGEDYGAAWLNFDNAGEMWFILPDEDKSIDDVLESGEYLEMFRNMREYENMSDNDINFSVPKFDVTSDIDLKEGLKALGVEDIFEKGEADFSPLLKEPDGFSIDKAEHAARVVIDEKGCTAAAYTVMAGGMGGPPDYEDLDFVLDRPFIFVITGENGNVLFMGVVYDVSA